MVRGPAANRFAEIKPRVRRGYFECRFGQLHVHNAIPPGGGFDEGTPLIALHPAPLSGEMFGGFLHVMGRDRSVYAPDMPGCGNSDSPAAPPHIADYAAAVGDFCDTMRFRQVDALGYRTGSLIAAELAIARPQQVRRIVLISVPVHTDAEREAFGTSPWPVPPSQDGSNLLVEWRRMAESYGAGVPLETLARTFADAMRNGQQARWGMQAAMQYPSRERLCRIAQPVLTLRPKDDLWEATARMRELLPKGRMVDLAEQGAGIFAIAPEVVASSVADFLRG